MNSPVRSRGAAVVVLPFLLLILLAPGTVFGDYGSSDGACASPHFINKNEASRVPSKYRDHVLTAGENQRLAATLAMKALPELVCKAVSGIAFVNTDLPMGAMALVNSSTPDLIIVSGAPGFASEPDLRDRWREGDRLPPPPEGSEMSAEERRTAKIAAVLEVWPRTIQAIMHEAGHCATYLVDSITDARGFQGGWDMDAVAAAQKAIQATRMQRGLLREWEEMNQRFLEARLGNPYVSDRLQDAKAQPPRSYMTLYGGKNAEEDIAETASWLTFKHFQKSFTLDDITTLDVEGQAGLIPLFDFRTACDDLRETTKRGIPGDLAGIYTKMNLIVDLGFASQESFDNCIGSGKIGLRRVDGGSGRGFQVFDGSNWNIINDYDKDIGMLRTDDQVKISARNVITRNGKDYPATLHLDIDIEPESYPRGVYTITKCNTFSSGYLNKALPNSDALFTLDVEGVRSNSFCAYTAIVLVSRARRGLLEGAVALNRFWKFSAPPVPENPKYPVQYTFVIK